MGYGKYERRVRELDRLGLGWHLSRPVEECR